MSQFPEPDVITIVDHHDQPVPTPDRSNPIDTTMVPGIILRDRLEPTPGQNTIPERDSDQLTKARSHLRAADETMGDAFKQIGDMKQEIKDIKHQLANAKKGTADNLQQPAVEGDVDIDGMKQEIQDLKLQLANAKTDTADAVHQLELERGSHDQSGLEAGGLGGSNELAAEHYLRDAVSQIGALQDEIRTITERAKTGDDRRRLKMEERRGQYRKLSAQLHLVRRYNASTWSDVGMAIQRMRVILGDLEEEDPR